MSICLYKFKRGKNTGKQCQNASIDKQEYCSKHIERENTKKNIVVKFDTTIEDTLTFFDEISKFFTIYELCQFRYLSKTFKNIVENSNRIWSLLIRENELYRGVLEKYPENTWKRHCIYIEYGFLCHQCVEYDCDCDDNTITKTNAKKIYKLTDDDLYSFDVQTKRHRLYKNIISFYNHQEIKQSIYSKHQGLTNYENYKELCIERKLDKQMTNERVKQRRKEKQLVKEHKMYDIMTKYYETLSRNEIKSILEEKLLPKYTQILDERIRKEKIQIENNEQEMWYEEYEKPKLCSIWTKEDREIELDQEFKRQKMTRRSDSTLCNQFINGRINYCIEHVVAIIKMTNILFSYSHIVYSEYHDECNRQILHFVCRNRKKMNYTWYDAVDDVHSKYEDEFDKSYRYY